MEKSEPQRVDSRAPLFFFSPPPTKPCSSTPQQTGSERVIGGMRICRLFVFRRKFSATWSSTPDRNGQRHFEHDHVFVPVALLARFKGGDGRGLCVVLDDPPRMIPTMRILP